MRTNQGEKLLDAKVPLYVFSPFNDLKENNVIFSLKYTISKCWIATNESFTSDAIDFAKCPESICWLGLSA
jgi:hypothetical protein